MAAVQPLSLILSAFQDFNVTEILITVLVLSVSLSLHEYAHAWMANRLGDDTAALAGRLTMNPLRHLDPMGSLVFLLTRRIGWAKPVPINPARFDRRHSLKKGIVLVSAAGPVSNLILGTVALILNFLIMTLGLWLGHTETTVFQLLTSTLWSFYYGNMLLGLFNALPLPPLDGYKVFGAILPRQLYLRIMRYERYIGLVFLLLILMGGGFLSRILNVLMIPFDFLIRKPVSWLFLKLWQGLGF